MRVLLVEDDENLRQQTSKQLRDSGFHVSEANSLSAARKIELKNIDLAVLDWGLPDGQGIDLLREWRSAGSQMPVIFLTARTDVLDKVLGLELGANDYLTKPFEPRELIARIRVQLRSRKSGKAGDSEADEIIECGGIKLNNRTREIFWHGESVELKKMEYDLLLLLISSPNQVFTRDELLNKVWGYDSYPTTRTVDNHIMHLRQKFSEDLFETVRGVGYRFKSGA